MTESRAPGAAVQQLKRLVQEIHRRSLWQVLLVYVGASWAVLEAADVLIERLALPDWIYGLAIILLLVGLPIVLATAFVQEGVQAPGVDSGPRSAGTGPDPAPQPAVSGGKSLRGMFTWRNAIAGGVLALALWGVVATGWYLVYGEGVVGPGAERKSVAVLPFVNVSADPDDEYFSDGITFEIITHLSKIADLKVISRTSIMQYKGTIQNIREIGRELGVATVVEGEVQRAGDRVRINAQLIDARTDEHLWAEQYDRELDDIFAIQSSVAQRIAGALRARLTTSEIERIERRPTEDLEAYNLYLQGRYFWAQRTDRDFRKAIDFFERAIGRDSTFALAYSGLADTYVIADLYTTLPEEQVVERALETAAQALQLDSTLAEAHTSLAFAKFRFEFDMAGAGAAFARAIRLNPGYAAAHHWYAYYLTAVGRSQESIEHARRARELDPLSVIISADLGEQLYMAGRYEEAAEHLALTLELDSTFALTHWHLGRVQLQLSETGSAIEHLRDAVRLSGGDPLMLGTLAYAYAVTGQRSEGRRLLGELEARSEQEDVPPLAHALVHVGLGDESRALESVERAFEERPFRVGVMVGDPILDPVRSSPRYRDILTRMELAEG